ncbi:MAG: DUF4230 domain-containing protein [Chloroflexia bacterium]|nr:DUF4230 domain-containing protein [Chloroflexia bacterium]
MNISERGSAQNGSVPTASRDLAEPPRGEPPPRSRLSWGWWIVSTFLVLFLVVLIWGFLGVERMFGQLISLPRQVVEEWQEAFPQSTPTVVVLPPALEQVRSLARLETTSYFLSTVVEVERPASGWPWTEQRLLLVAHGQVVAGVDLSLLQEEQVQVVGGRVMVRLPEAEVFHVFLDEDETYVYDYKKGLFARYDVSLESQARSKALEEFRRTALENGILEEARRQAEWEVQRLLLMLGYEQVEFP